MFTKKKSTEKKKQFTNTKEADREHKQCSVWEHEKTRLRATNKARRRERSSWDAWLKHRAIASFPPGCSPPPSPAQLFLRLPPPASPPTSQHLSDITAHSSVFAWDSEASISYFLRLLNFVTLHTLACRYTENTTLCDHFYFFQGALNRIRVEGTCVIREQTGYPERFSRGRTLHGVNVTHWRGKCEAVVNERLTVVKATEIECKMPEIVRIKVQLTECVDLFKCLS